MYNSQILNRQFTIQIGADQLSFHLNSRNLKAILVNTKQYQIYQQTYSQNHLPDGLKQNFRNSSEIFGYFDKLKQRNNIWELKQSSKITVKPDIHNKIQFNLKKVTDQVQFSRIILIKLMKAKQLNNNKTQQAIKQVSIVKNTQQNYQKQLAIRLKGIGEIIQSLHQNLDKKSQQIRQINKIIEQIRQQYGRKQDNKNKEQGQFKSENSQGLDDQRMMALRTQLSIVQKTMNRNILTFKQQFELQKLKTQKSIQYIQQQIKKYNFPKIKQENLMILDSFESQIRIKDYQFIPSVSSLNNCRKIYFLNKKILKNLQDAKDYNKIRSQSPIPYGIYRIQISVRNLKSNGLMFGICNNKVMNQLQKVSFNDRNLVSFNSCGYIINRGMMVMSNGRIKIGDVVKMIVNISRGQIRWSCNDIEIALADVSWMKKQDIYPILGLGFFGDQIQIKNSSLQNQQIAPKQSYKDQLARINQRYKIQNDKF